MKTNIYASHALLVCVLTFVSFALSAQTGSIGIGTVSPDTSSIMDIRSSSKGVLLPRLTVAQKNAILTPAQGLLVYITDSIPGFYFYVNGWRPLTPSLTGLANDSLSNLKMLTKVNTDLVADTSGKRNLGSSSVAWKDQYLSGDVYIQNKRFISIRQSNNFVGASAGNPAVTGYYNTATGADALKANVTGNWNTAIGYATLTGADNSYSNTCTGFQAMVSATTASYNTATGVLSLGANVTGIANSATGVASLQASTSGNYNSTVGYFSGSKVTTGNFNTLLGANADVASGALSNATAVGNSAVATASNSVRIGNSSVTSIGGQVNWTAFSDGRYKKNIHDNVPGLNFINQLRPVTYNLDVAGIDKALRPARAQAKAGLAVTGSADVMSAAEARDMQEKANIQFSGFIAQEVEATAKKVHYDFSGVDKPKNSNDFYGLRYGDFVVPLVKAVQELSKKTSEIAELKAVIAKQHQQMETLKAAIGKQQQEMATLKASVTLLINKK